MLPGFSICIKIMSSGLVKFNNRDISIEEILATEKSITPPSDIFETEDSYRLVINMPGDLRNNISVRINDSKLIIFGRVNSNEFMNRNYVLVENEVGNNYRTFKLSDSIDLELIEAKYENGQLILNLPKQEKFKPRTIPIL